jgi:hypothetical protein
MKPRVVIGFLGSTLDQGKIRTLAALCPTVALCRTKIWSSIASSYSPGQRRRGARHCQVSPETEVRLHT